VRQRRVVLWCGRVGSGWVGWRALLVRHLSMCLACLWHAVSMHLACVGHPFPNVQLQPFLLLQPVPLASPPKGCAQPSHGHSGSPLDHLGNRPRLGLQRTRSSRPTTPPRFRCPRLSSQIDPRSAGCPLPIETGRQETSIPWHQGDVEASPSSGVVERLSRFAHHQP
jgi:hypothetical protein